MADRQLPRAPAQIPETNFPPAWLCFLPRCSLAGPLMPPAQPSGLRTRTLEPGRRLWVQKLLPCPSPLLSVSGRRCTSFEVSEGYRWHSIEESHDLCVKGAAEGLSFPTCKTGTADSRLFLKSHPSLTSVMLKVLFTRNPEGKAPWQRFCCHAVHSSAS